MDETQAEEAVGLGVRLAARAIDVVVVTVAAGALGGVMGFGFDWLMLGAALIFGYFVVADAWLGATLGKRLLGLRVRGPDGGRPTFAQAAAREAFTVLGAVPFAGPLLALAAWLWIAVAIWKSDAGQGPHDRVAGGTRVVRR